MISSFGFPAARKSEARGGRDGQSDRQTDATLNAAPYMEGDSRNNTSSPIIRPQLGLSIRLSIDDSPCDQRRS